MVVLRRFLFYHDWSLHGLGVITVDQVRVRGDPRRGDQFVLVVFTHVPYVLIL